MADIFAPYRDELVIATKAGFHMWDGPYGEWGSKKHMMASLEQSLKRLKLDYVDIFYHHRPDPNTPVEETLDTLKLIIRQGKALYVAVSNYTKADMDRILPYAKSINLPILCNQVRYSLLKRPVFEDQQDLLRQEGIGTVAYAPLSGGLLTDRYLNGIPGDSRIRTDGRFLKETDITPELIERLKRLELIAKPRGQKLSQMSLAWVLAQAGVTTALIGASRPEQIEDAVNAVKNSRFIAKELEEIEEIIK
jgi:L-glyceraldehyde 3-phosphate reductase